MTTRRLILYTLGALSLSLFGYHAEAELIKADTPINSLYNNLLQREYIGPVVFPNHQVERKAQRSPSLRLRFGRSDPDLASWLPSADKRWFGEVNQKPIRSPSLRLRFGRRSDPSVPLHSRFDELMMRYGDGGGAAGGDGDGGGSGVADESNNNLADIRDVMAKARLAALLSNSNNNLENFDNGEENGLDAATFNRVLRKPQRLRWGRSVPNENQFSEEDNNNYVAEETDQRRLNTNDDYLNALLTAQKLRTLLLALRGYAENEEEPYEREIRKPSPMRLRFGRSAGGKTTATTTATASDIPLTAQKNAREKGAEEAKNAKN